jgi:HK97 family phage prohead protease
MTIERRFNRSNVSCETREDKTRKIVGYAAVFFDGTPATEFQPWEGVVERIMSTAFDRAVKEDDVRALFNHDSNMVLGRTSAGTLGLVTDGTGLAYTIDPPDTQLGRDLATIIGRRDVTGSSFAFLVTDQRWIDDEANKRTIREINAVQLFDVGPVTFPAYEATEAGLRSVGGIDEARASFDKWQGEQATARRTAAESAAVAQAQARDRALTLEV